MIAQLSLSLIVGLTMLAIMNARLSTSLDLTRPEQVLQSTVSTFYCKVFKKKKTLTYFLLLEMTSEEKAEYENAKANGLLEVVADEEEKVIEKKKVKEEKKEKVQKK